jgi:hypothetical protein
MENVFVVEVLTKLSSRRKKMMNIAFDCVSDPDPVGVKGVVGHESVLPNDTQGIADRSDWRHSGSDLE